VARQITLTKEQVAIVDDDQFELLKPFKWYARWCKETKSFYAYRSVKVGPQKWYMQGMHRDVLGLEPYNPLVGDHVEPSRTLDNQRINLRVTNH
jgi:hypothetical protein